MNIFKRPSYADETETQKAQILWVALIAVLITANAVIPIICAISGKPALPLLGALLLYDVVCPIFLWRTHRGNIPQLSYVVLATFIAALTFTAWRTDGIHAAAMLGFMVCIGLGGLLCGPRTGVTLAGACIMIGFGLALAQYIDLLPNNRLSYTPFSEWLVVSCYFMFLTAILIFYSKTAAQAFEQHRIMFLTAEQSPLCIMLTDNSGRIEYVNPKFVELTGYTLDEIKGQNPRLFKSKAMDPAVYRTMWDTITKGKTWKGVFENQNKQGAVYVVQATISPVTDLHGHTTRFMGVMEDITNQRDLENQLRQAQKMDAIGQLAGGVAHDFNNLLTAIMLQTELVKDALKGTGIERQADDILKTAERAAALTRQLLVFSRRQSATITPTNLQVIFGDYLKMLKRIVGDETQIQIQADPQARYVLADEIMLEQVVMNLVVNARDAMTKGGTVVIRTSVIDSPGFPEKNVSPGKYIRLTVQDTGTGMSPEIQKRIFEPFFTTKEIGRGTGLGLATVYGIVQLHKGWIEIESVVGKGSSFHVHLPMGVSKNDTNSPIKSATVRGTGTVLLVEDNPIVRDSTQALIRTLGYKVVITENAIQARTLWKTNPDAYDVILTDMSMPGGVTGLELIKDCRAHRPQTKAIIMSGLSDKEARPADIPFLQKPFTRETLSIILAKTLKA